MTSYEFDTSLDPDYPVLTRGNAGEIMPDIVSPLSATVFFVTHSIEEAVYLGDRVYIMSAAPGTIIKEIPVPPPDRPAREMQRDPRFMEIVYELRDMMEGLESGTRAGDA